MEFKKISIIIPNYNGATFLKTCLDSLQKQSFQDFELIVVDNGSRDDSITLTKKMLPSATIFQYDKNTGFSKAVNRGISLARGKYIFLLNNDTELDQHCLKYLADFLDNNPQASFVAPKMLYLNNKEIINNAGDTLSIYGLAHKRGNGEKDQGQYDQVEPIFGACAGGAIYRRELFDMVGLFDESFFAYLEDVDFSFRAQSQGYHCYYLPGRLSIILMVVAAKKIKDFPTTIPLEIVSISPLKTSPAPGYSFSVPLCCLAKQEIYLVDCDTAIST